MNIQKHIKNVEGISAGENELFDFLTAINIRKSKISGRNKNIHDNEQCSSTKQKASLENSVYARVNA